MRRNKERPIDYTVKAACRKGGPAVAGCAAHAGVRRSSPGLVAFLAAQGLKLSRGRRTNHPSFETPVEFSLDKQTRNVEIT
jgi:hypothetical protein